MAWEMNAIPRRPGVYVLHLYLSQPCCLQIGRLGIFNFDCGSYLYAGSALGPGGLRARLGRHLRGAGPPHWHIDYLRAAAEVVGFIWLEAEASAWPAPAGLSPECRLARCLAAHPAASIPAPRFGSSDCRGRCPAHLVALALCHEQVRSILDLLPGLMR
jgi:Uri superfamily endonuclease